MTSTMKFNFIPYVTGLLVMFSLTATNAQQHWSPDHVYYGQGGVLTFRPDELGNIIPDFSNVGYRYGDEPIPDIAVKIEVQPVEGDDGSTIQSAIDAVAAMAPDENGFRGAVLLKTGTYQVAGQINITTSGIVLRGEGDTDNGTVIIAEGTERRELIKVDNGSSRNVDASTNVSIDEAYVPVGRKYVIVTSAAGFNSGDQIVLYRPGTANWISDIKMDQLTPSEGTVQWSPSSYSFYFERLVTRVTGDTIFFRNPVVMAMEDMYGGGTVSKFSFNRLENIGIENLCLKSAYTSDTDEEHSWKAISFGSVENGWVRNVTSWNFAYSCVSLERNSRLITVEDCNSRDPISIITGGRRYSFNLTGSLNLFKGCTTTEGRHDFVTGSRVCGPNVFTNCSASKTHSDIGPHHRWAMGTLFDMIVSDGKINVQDRDDMGTGHGWAGANQVFWNSKGSSSICQNPWTSAKNYNFGFQGTREEGARSGRPGGEWIGHNVPGIFPSSLYEAQLDERKNGTTYFSAISNLKQRDDSTFIMSFTLPLKASQITNDNIIVGGSAGADSKEYTVELNDESSVAVTFSGLGILPALSTITITARNLTTGDGKALNGVLSGSYTEPDKRPVVSGIELTVDNETGFVVASSSKTGHVYIIKFGENPESKSEIDSLVGVNLGISAEVMKPDVSVPLYTKGLPGGFYNYYAVDEDGRVSLPGKKWVIVEETGPVGDADQSLALTPFRAYQVNDLIIVDPGNQEGYSLELFNVSGKLLYKETELAGKQYLNREGRTGLLIIRKSSNMNIDIQKLILN